MKTIHSRAFHAATIALAWLAVVCGATSASAEFEVSTAIGGQFGGDVTVANGTSSDIGVDGGFFWKTNLDWFQHPNLGFGGYFAYGTSYNGLLGDLNILEFGLAIKPRLTVEDISGELDFLVTPGVMVGYRGLFASDADDSNGLGVNLGVDLRLRFPSGIAVFLEPGFITQPTGGNDDVDVTFAPLFYMLVGVSRAF